ncbi:MAG: glucose-1-phosphate cytidylyltransferase [Bdellovibrionales bacterium]|nr:glucose-1-phosphate cytidylyltransferase [Bdellovibrionales bacterium]
MKAVILAGGHGTRISEESHLKPKPMIEIGGKPILWHILKTYSHFGINDFIICCGYKGYVIKEFFANYFLHNSDVTYDLSNNSTTIHDSQAEPWKITVVDTGEGTMTGGRLKRVAKYLDPKEDFCFTYGDGVSDVNISELIKYHKSEGRLSTVTVVQPSGRFGLAQINSGKVESFYEKPHGDGGFINGGFFVLNPQVIDYIPDDLTVWERTPMETLVKEGQMSAYQHKGFWHPMDTLRDKVHLEDLWNSQEAPWKVW